MTGQTNFGQSDIEPSIVGLIGLGLVGTAIAERLIAAGFEVQGYDPILSVSQNFTRIGGISARSASEVIFRCKCVLLSLPDGDIVRKVVELIKADLKKGSLIIDTSTSSPEQVLETGRLLKELNVGYLDATISGSSEQVRSGDATWLVGGEAKLIEWVSPVFNAIGGKFCHLGGVGAGTRMKLVSNLILGLNRAVLAEGLALAESWNMDLMQTLEVLKSTAAYSKVMDIKGKKMVERDYFPQARLKQHHKDVRLIVQSANQSGMELPLSELHDQLLTEAENRGLGDLDNSSIAEVWRRRK